MKLAGRNAIITGATLPPLMVASPSDRWFVSERPAYDANGFGC
jgi:hypothetical protein